MTEAEPGRKIKIECPPEALRSLEVLIEGVQRHVRRKAAQKKESDADSE